MKKGFIALLQSSLRRNIIKELGFDNFYKANYDKVCYRYTGGYNTGVRVMLIQSMNGDYMRGLSTVASTFKTTGYIKRKRQELRVRVITVSPT